MIMGNPHYAIDIMHVNRKITQKHVGESDIALTQKKKKRGKILVDLIRY